MNNQPLKLNSHFILPIAMLYLMAMLAADAVAFKFVGVAGIALSGATVVFPFTYLFSDVIAEVYGYDTARRIIWLSLFCELFFAIIIKGVIRLPYPAFANYQAAFNLVDGSLIRFVMGGIVGNVASSFLNIYLISKWKIMAKGRVFWLRSIVATAISELLITCIAVLIGFSSVMSIWNQLKVIVCGYSLEMFYAVIFVWPAWGISAFLKAKEGIDSYDYGVNYNPFRFTNQGETQ